MYSATLNTYSHALPANFEANAVAAGLDWQKILLAFQQYGVPLVVGVVTAIVTKDYGALLSLALQYGVPLVSAIYTAITGKSLPTVP